MADTLTTPPDPLSSANPAAPAVDAVDSAPRDEASEENDGVTTTSSSTVQADLTTDSTAAPMDTTDSAGPQGEAEPSSDSPQLPSDDRIVESMRDIIKCHDLSEITLRMLVGLLEKEFGQDLSSKKAFVKENIPVLLQELQEQNGEEQEEEVKEEADEDEDEAKEEASGEENEEDAKAAQEALNLSGEDLEVQKLLMEQIKYGGGRVTRGRASGRAAPKPLPKKKRKSTDGEGEEAPAKKKKGTSRVNRPKHLSPALAEFIGEKQMARPDVVKKLHEYIKSNNLQDPKNKRNIIFDDKLQQVFKRKTTDFFKLNTLLSKHLTDPGELL